MTFNNHLNLAVLSQVAEEVIRAPAPVHCPGALWEKEMVCVVYRSCPFLSFVLLTKRPFACVYLWSLHILLMLACHAVRLTGDSKFPVGVNGCLCRSPVTGALSTVPCLSPKDSWDLLPNPMTLSRISSIERRLMWVWMWNVAGVIVKVESWPVWSQ